MSGRYKVAWLCEALLVSRSGYYDWKKRQSKPGPRQMEKMQLRQRIREALSAVVRRMAARGWLKCLAVREDATALPVSCAQSASSHVSVPSIAWLPPTAATVGRSRRTGFEFSRSNGLIRLGPPTPLVS